MDGRDISLPRSYLLFVRNYRSGEHEERARGIFGSHGEVARGFSASSGG